MTHKQLLEKIKPKETITIQNAIEWYNSLEQVIKFHGTRKAKRMVWSLDGKSYYKWCLYCKICKVEYPCPTMEVIEAVLDA